MYLKAGVKIDKLTPQILLAGVIANAVWVSRGLGRCTITSCNDGVHSGKPVVGDTVDPHYLGKAIDLRIITVPVAQRQSVFDDIVFSLTTDYVVLWEMKGTPNEHFHIQFGHIA